MAVKFVLVRHTQTDDNAQRKYTGQNNVPLNELGVSQAESLASQIAQLSNIQAIFSSDLQRTRKVAEIIASQIGLKPIFTAALREVDVGQIAGMLKDEAIAQYPDDKYRTSELHFDFTDIGGESVQQVMQRFEQCLAEIDQQYGTERPVVRVVVVTHGSALRRFFVQEHQLLDKIHAQGEYQEVDWPPAQK